MTENNGMKIGAKNGEGVDFLSFREDVKDGVVNAKSSIVEKECPICFEQIGNKNTCTTECGHTFCFKCMAESIQRNVKCPCCRFELVKPMDEEDIDDDETEETNSDDDDDDDDDGEASIEQITSIFEKKGYTLMDAISLLCGRLSKQENKNTNEYYEKISDDFDKIIDELDNDACNEHNEREDMMFEDVRC